MKPGSELMPLFGAGRVLVEIPPASMKKIPSGRLPDARQPLRDDIGIRPFFMKKAVITAAGGVSALESWLRRQVKNCQWTHSDYHHHELVPFRHSTGVIIACWHCDNELKYQTEQTLDQLVGVNNADWVIDTARIALGLDAQRSLSLAELCWWAVGAGIGDEITEEMARRSLRIKDDSIKSVYRESEIVPSVPATSILSTRLEKAIKPTAITTPGKPLVPVAPWLTDSEARKRVRWCLEIFRAKAFLSVHKAIHAD